MVNPTKALASKKLSKDDERVIINLCNSPVATSEFLRVLNEAQNATQEELNRTTQAYLVNDEQKTRAMALVLKGKSEMLDEIMSLIKTLTNVKE